jgi:serine/threonine-protein kinase RIO1
VKKTKWLYFVEALNETGAMRDISVAGANDEERMQNFARSLLGMVFRWQEKECESLVKIRGGEFKKFNVLLPVEYLGKKPIEAAPEVKQVSLEESAPKKEGID